MGNIGLFEMPSTGNHFTWSNHHSQGLIYSRIDRVIANVEWFAKFSQYQLQVLTSGVSDHSPLLLTDMQFRPTCHGKKLLRFLSYVANEPMFFASVQESWLEPIRGSTMYVLWQKLRRLQHVIRRLGTNIHIFLPEFLKLETLWNNYRLILQGTYLTQYC